MSGLMVALVAGGMTLLTPAPAAFASAQGSTAITAGDDHACMIVSGAGYCWGDNQYGQLGDGSYTSSAGLPEPVTMPSGVTFTQISAGTQETCAVGNDSVGPVDGQVYCWGDNSDGQLGVGASPASADVPTLVSGSGTLPASGVTQVTVGTDYGCAIVAGGSGAAYCWGLGTSGQLGNNGDATETEPVTVFPGPTDGWTEIAAGNGVTCALGNNGATPTTEGLAWCWGSNTDDAFGNGLTSIAEANASIPQAVDQGSVRYSNLAVGGLHACVVAVTTDLAYCWGDDSDSALGDGLTADEDAPVAVHGTTTFSQITAGNEDTCAITTSGAAMCWGDDTYGEVGDEYVTPTYYPANVYAAGVLGSADLTQIAGGYASNCALSTASVLYCWGEDNDGQLGNYGYGQAAAYGAPVLATFEPPTTVTAGAGNGTATVQWNLVTGVDTDNQTVAGYTVSLSSGSTITLGPASDSYTFSGLTSCDWYDATVTTNTIIGTTVSSLPSLPVYVIPAVGSCGGGGGGPYRQVASGKRSLAQIASDRGTTVADLVTVTEGSHISAVNLEKFLAAAAHPDRKLRKGTVYYTQNR